MKLCSLKQRVNGVADSASYLCKSGKRVDCNADRQKLVGVAPEVNQRNRLFIGNKAHE